MRENQIITYSNHFYFNGARLAFRKKLLFDITATPRYIPYNGIYWLVNKRQLTILAAKKYIKQVGKVGKARAADRRAKLKAEPANHEGYRQCYICFHMFKYVDLEHEEDASTHPELRHDPDNHKWACNPCNIKKKRHTKAHNEEAL